MAAAVTIADLLAKAGDYLPADRLPLLEGAYAFAARAHEGQVRRSGEPYVMHPLHTALIVAELQLDANALAAALLHDVPEDCGVPLARIASEFGPEVSTLVDGVTKLSRLEWRQPEEPAKGHVRAEDVEIQAENLRKMFVAMAQDIRVVLIKLADRLHNMRTLKPLLPPQRRAVAQETREIYAPLAHRLGIFQLEWELEDLAFRWLEPLAYRRVAHLVASQREEQERYIARVIQILQGELEGTGIAAEVLGRRKHLYSIYTKLQKYASQGKDFFQIHDILALRVLVDQLQDCYSVLGLVHGLWHPIPGEFDDYIANPKESGYQSLHTTVMCLEGQPLEIQIRTYEMHWGAEYGIAAHWRYKEGPKADLKFEEKIAWLRQLLDWHRELRGAQEFVESIKTDIFQDQVFVFTPKGEIKDLPSGSTPIDFAYRIHTDLGNRCSGAKVNGRLVSLDYQLQNGDVVLILTAKADKGPSLDWLNSHLGYVKTSHAREKIRQWFRRRERAENIARGKELLERELRRLALKASEEEIARLCKYDRAEDLLAALGSGDLNPHQIALRWAAQEEKPALPPGDGERPVLLPVSVQVLGVGDLLTRLGRCCHPVPGDEIVGFVTRTRGVTVHRTDCHNILHERERERIVEVNWGGSAQLYPVPIRVEAWDRVGLLRDISSVVSGEHVNMAAVTVTTHEDRTATVSITLETTGLSQLSRVLAKLEGVPAVISVARALEPVARENKT